MAQAVIQVSLTGGAPWTTLAGSEYTVTPGTLVYLRNNNVGDETAWAWEQYDQPQLPVGAADDSLSSASIYNPTITLNKEGTYHFKLTTEDALANTYTDQGVIRVLYVRIGTCPPAAGERSEASTTRGWAVRANKDLDTVYRNFDRAQKVVVARNDEGSPTTTGEVVMIKGVAVIKSGLPAEEYIPTYQLAAANDPARLGTQGIILSEVDGTATIAASGLARVVMEGMWQGDTSSFSKDDILYIQDAAGDFGTTPGSSTAIIGKVVVAAASGFVWVYPNG